MTHAQRNVRNGPRRATAGEEGSILRQHVYADYVTGGRKNPSDDLVTELLDVEFEDATAGRRRRVTKDELLTFLAVIAGAGVDTTGRLFGWMGKVLAEHADQTTSVGPRPLARRRMPSKSCLRYEPPGPHVARYLPEDCRVPRTSRAGGQRTVADARVGQSGRAPVRRTLKRSTSTATSDNTSRSATGLTTAWVLRWLVSRVGSRSTRS